MELYFLPDKQSIVELYFLPNKLSDYIKTVKTLWQNCQLISSTIICASIIVQPPISIEHGFQSCLYIWFYAEISWADIWEP